MRILFDVSRTLLHRYHSSPTGIDRVEYAYVRALITHRRFRDVHFVASTRFGTGTVPQAVVQQIVRTIDAQWQANEGAQSLAFYDRLKGFLESRHAAPAAGVTKFRGDRGKPREWRAYAEMIRICTEGHSAFRRVLAQARSTPTLYFHVSHLQLEHARRYAWLAGSKVFASFMVHDLIPLEFPEFCAPASVDKHERRLSTMRRHGGAVISVSHHTKAAFEAYAAARNLSAPPIIVSKLGTQIFDHGEELPPPVAAVPYFVHIGTIEGRKNILHLLNVWRRLVHELAPERVPRLVLVGRRGWNAQGVMDVLDSTRELAPYVVEVSGLTDRGLTALLRGATALLSASLVEGFGLPPVEALSRHIPVIASDIAVHRENLEGFATLLDPTDGVGWRNAIFALASDPEHRAQLVRRSSGFALMAWDDHVDFTLDRLTEAAAATLPAPPPPR